LGEHFSGKQIKAIFSHAPGSKPLTIRVGLSCTSYWNTDLETGAITESQEAKDFGCKQSDFIQIPANYGANPNVIYSGLRQPWTILDDSNLCKNFTITEAIKASAPAGNLQHLQSSVILGRELTTGSTNMPGKLAPQQVVARAISHGMYKLL